MNKIEYSERKCNKLLSVHFAFGFKMIIRFAQEKSQPSDNRSFRLFQYASTLKSQMNNDKSDSDGPVLAVFDGMSLVRLESM